MSTAEYTGTLTDIGLGLLNSYRPVVQVRPEFPAFGPDGLVSAAPKTVDVDPSTGGMTMHLIPSAYLSSPAAGDGGVRYILKVGRFEDTITGQRFHGSDVFRFTAVVGGGNIGEMSSGPQIRSFFGPPWPTTSRPGVYLDKVTGDYGIYGLEI